VVADGLKWLRLVCDAQLPVVKVVRTEEPRLPITYSVITSSRKISKLRPKALGFRLKYPSVGG